MRYHMMRILNCSLILACVFAGLSSCLASGDINDVKYFLQLHNEARAKIKAGQIEGLPCAESLPPLIWDEELAEKAQAWANRCEPLPQSHVDRPTSKFPHVGLNWAGIYNLTESFHVWFVEYKLYHAGPRDCENYCGHYREIVEATHIGCAKAECKRDPWNPVHVCMYGPGAAPNYSREPPYKVSATCSDPKPPSSVPSSYDVKEFLNLHNQARRALQQGKLCDQPCAESMPEMVWDDGLAATAQKWADKCEIYYQPMADRATTEIKDVGQSIARGYNLTEAFNSWLNRYLDYEFGSQDCTTYCEPYIQIVSARTTKVGCAYSLCPHEKGGHIFVCNYGPTGMVKQSKKSVYGSMIETPYTKASTCPLASA